MNLRSVKTNHVAIYCYYITLSFATILRNRSALLILTEEFSYDSLQFGTVKSLNCQFDLVIHRIPCELLRSIKILRF